MTDQKTPSSPSKSPEPGKSTLVKDLISQISRLTILELNELVGALQTEFNIQPLQNLATGAGSASDTAEEKKPDVVNVVLTEIGESKIAVIKALSSITKKGLMEAKKMLDKLPLTISENQQPDAANEIKVELEKAGAVIVLK